jgi:site-specific DNA recombinase
MPKTRVIGYVRVSTEEQASDGISLQAQREKIELFCNLHEHTLVRITEDAGASGKTLDRAGIRSILHEMRSKSRDAPQGIVITKLDRLTRSLRDWSELIDEFFDERAKHKRQLFSVGDSIDTTNASGRLILNVLMTVAQWEREVIAERTRDTLQSKIRRGERCGKVRFGYNLADDGKTLVKNEREQEAIARLKEWRSQGRTYRELVRLVEGLGIDTKSGGVWRPATIRQMLLRPIA